MTFKKILAGVMASAMTLTAGFVPLKADVFDAEQTGITVNAEESETSGECGENVTWRLDENGVLTISGKGAIYDYPDPQEDWDNKSPFHAIYGGIEIESVIIEDGVTSIGSYAFCNANQIRSIVIPDSVNLIGSMAFSYCFRLTKINLPDNITTIPDKAFYRCERLQEMTIPDSVTSIGNSAFQYTLIKNIVIPDTVTYIGEEAFMGCKALKSITIENPDCEIYDASTTITNYFEEPFENTICGYTGSTAQAYAEKYNYKFESLDDGSVTTEPVTTTVTTTEITITTVTTEISEVTSESVTTSSEETITTVAPVTTTVSAPEPERIKGDISGNGNIDLYDAIEIAKSLIGIRKFTEEEKKIADFNGDGKVDLYDAIAIAKYLLKK